MDPRVVTVVTERAPGAQQLATPHENPVGGAVGPPCLMRVSSVSDAEETVVALRGEIDYGCEEALERALTHILSASDRGIGIDLSKVSFWACSSVKVLLTVRQVALRHGKTVSLRATSPAVRRVLELSGTLRLFTTSTAPASPHLTADG
ncbi:anti-anti-sigma factor [Streptomyces sp. 2224.1]|nr:anti-anti-sigma factor [Streptomyces sp. 2224.1]